MAKRAGSGDTQLKVNLPQFLLPFINHSLIPSALDLPKAEDPS
jgi:hypothetical protein